MPNNQTTPMGHTTYTPSYPRTNQDITYQNPTLHTQPNTKPTYYYNNYQTMVNTTNMYPPSNPYRCRRQIGEF